MKLFLIKNEVTSMHKDNKVISECKAEFSMRGVA